MAEQNGPQQSNDTQQPQTQTARTTFSMFHYIALRINILILLHAFNHTVQSSVLPPSGSITIGEIDGVLVFITKNESDENRKCESFIAKKGEIFKSIAIPIKYFDRYSSHKKIENKELQQNVMNVAFRTLSTCIESFKMAWNLSSPCKMSNHLVQQYHPSIAQQTTNSYYSEASPTERCKDQSDKIIKFDYHPLFRKLVIAFKNGIVFFDLKRNQWLQNTLQNESQTDIKDFAISHSGHYLVATCTNGIFLWDLTKRPYRGELIESFSCNAYEKITFSPCDKYIAVHKVHGHSVSIFDFYSKQMVYQHRMIFGIRKIEWIPSTKQNKFCEMTYPVRKVQFFQ